MIKILLGIFLLFTHINASVIEDRFKLGITYEKVENNPTENGIQFNYILQMAQFQDAKSFQVGLSVGTDIYEVEINDNKTTGSSIEGFIFTGLNFKHEYNIPIESNIGLGYSLGKVGKFDVQGVGIKFNIIWNIVDNFGVGSEFKSFKYIVDNNIIDDNKIDSNINKNSGILFIYFNFN